MRTKPIRFFGGVAFIALNQCKEAMFDAADVELIWDYDWSFVVTTNGHPYVACQRRNAAGRKVTIYMHRLITGAPKGKIVDHINGDGLDNRRCNLRICNHAQNRVNSRLNRNNTSGFRGVQKRGNGWIARIGIDGRKVELGTFPTAELASEAYEAAATRHYGEFVNRK